MSLRDYLLNRTPYKNNRWMLYKSGGVSPSFILDTVTALNGYSLRKLKSTATKAVRVRRSSDNAEQDIGFVGEDLDESALTTFVGANDGFVVTLYNQVDDGATDNYTQSTQLNQIRIVSGGVIDKLNSRPTMCFYQSNLWLDISKTIVQPIALNTISRLDDTGATQTMISISLILEMTFADFWRMNSGSNIDGSVVSLPKAFNTTAYYNGASSVLRVDGVDKTGDSGTNSFSNTRLGKSGASPFSGDVSEFIILSNLSEISTLESNQNTYYSIV